MANSEKALRINIGKAFSEFKNMDMLPPKRATQHTSAMEGLLQRPLKA